MYIILPLVIIIAAVIYLAFSQPVKLSFLLDSDKNELHSSMQWLSLLQVEAEMAPSRPHISVYLFGKKLFSKLIMKRKKANHTVLSALSLQNTRIKAYYGLHAPHLTGIFNAVISMLASFIDAESFEQYPEFIPAHEYLKIQGSANLNVGKTIAHMMQLNLKKGKGENNGSVDFN